MHYDPAYFADPKTEEFRFPAYTLHWKGMVQIRDLTAYKKDCFQGLSENDIRLYSLRDFESAKLTPKFEVESLWDFIKRFPESSFNKGITKSALWELLDLYNPFNEDYSKVNDKHDVDFPLYEVEDAILIGLMERIDIAANPVKFWSKLENSEIWDLCLEYNIPQQSTKKKEIEQLLEHNVPYPRVWSRPTQLLKEVYLNFVDLYIQDIKQNTIHFHPRLLKALWLYISECNKRTPVSAKIKQFIKAPYWMTAQEPEVCFDNWSNAAFTFQPPLASKDPIFVQPGEDPNDVPNGGFYLKAKEGVFDETFFKDPGTGSFCFPNYTDRHTGMVYIGDITNYKKMYPPASDFSIDKMERNFVTPEWEFRELSEFIEDLSATYLKEGLSGKRLSSIFHNNYRYLNEGNEHEIKCELLSPNDPLIGYGFFVPADPSLFPPAKSWNAMSEEALVATCKENGIKPAKQKISIIWQLIDNNIPFPLSWYKPTSTLTSYFHSFIELYITDIRNSTDHFHPLYFISLWGELKDAEYNFKLAEMVNEILINPYWKDRLFRAPL